MYSCGPLGRGRGGARWVSRSAQCSYHWLSRRAHPSSAQPGQAGLAVMLAPRDVLAQCPDGAAKVDMEFPLARRAGTNAAAQGRHAAGVQLLQQVQPLAGRRSTARCREGPRRTMPRRSCAERPADRQQGGWRRRARRARRGHARAGKHGSGVWERRALMCFMPAVYHCSVLYALHARRCAIPHRSCTRFGK